jgi:hypothetical protein
VALALARLTEGFHAADPYGGTQRPRRVGRGRRGAGEGEGVRLAPVTEVQAELRGFLPVAAFVLDGGEGAEEPEYTRSVTIAPIGGI